MDTIPLCRAHIESSELKAVEEVLKSGWLTHGPKTTEFENVFAEYVGVKHAVAMNSCTSALFLAIKANNITGEVLVPSFTFVASANAIVTAGATPVFVEIKRGDGNINSTLLEAKLTASTQAVMAVHFAGQCCEMDQILDFSRRHNLIIIEDSAETLGGTYKGKKSGSWGTGCFSFFPTKNITTGEGGMLTTNDDDLMVKVRALIGHGIEKSSYDRSNDQIDWRRVAQIPGYNFRLSNILAALGVEQMKKLDKMNSDRRERSFYLLDCLKNVEELELPNENEDCDHVYQMFTVKVKRNRDDIVLKLRNKDIQASVHFDPPVHLHPAYRQYSTGQLPVTETTAKNIITLPMFPQLNRQDLDYMAESLKDIFTHG